MENKIKSIIIATLLLIMPSISFAGIVKGKIIEQGTNEPLTGATIVANDGQGTSADIDGNYSLKLQNGTYTLTVRFIGCRTMVKDNVKVTGDELVLDFVLEPDNTTLGEITVSSTLRHNTDASTTREQREAHVTMTGVSEMHIKRTQDKDAGEVIRRIPGVSIIDEKFVMVRGLSQRYNNVWLNGAAVPSSEADQRAFSFDIIPSSQLDNMMVVKSSAPEYPADFSGGFILVNTYTIIFSSRGHQCFGKHSTTMAYRQRTDMGACDQRQFHTAIPYTVRHGKQSLWCLRCDTQSLQLPAPND